MAPLAPDSRGRAHPAPPAALPRLVEDLLVRLAPAWAEMRTILNELDPVLAAPSPLIGPEQLMAARHHSLIGATGESGITGYDRRSVRARTAQLSRCRCCRGSFRRSSAAVGGRG